MSAPALTRLGICIACVVLLAHCASDDPTPSACKGIDLSCALAGVSGAATAGSASGSGAGTPPIAGATGTGGAATGGAPAAGGGGLDGGATAAGGNANGGTLASGGAAGTAGSGATAGADTSGGAANAGGSSAGTANASGGATNTAGSNSSTGGDASGGTSGSSGAAGTAGGPVVDENGVPLAKPGDSKNESRTYLNLGDMRLIVNKWGSDELGCGTSLRVFVNDDKTFGWEFDRGACGGNKEKPDYPEIEFGVHPFGAGNSLATTPAFSSTSLLPIQIKDLESASVLLDELNINIERASTYNLNFEFWLSQRNPLEADPGVHAELITFFGWQDDWACDKTGNVQAGDRAFNLCHQDDQWAGGKWRYFQFRLNGGPSNGFSGKIDVKALVDWLVTNAGYSRDLWISRFEVGSEIDDNTKGRVTLRNVTFEVNGTSKSAEFDE